MSNADRDLRVRATLDTSGFTAGANQIKNSLNGVKSSTNGVFSGMVSKMRGAIDTWSQMSQAVNSSAEIQKKSMEKLRLEQIKLTNREKDQVDTLNTLTETMEKHKERIKQLTDAQEFNVDEIMETEERLAQCQEQYKNMTRQLERTRSRLAMVTEEMENGDSSCESLTDVTKNLTGAWKDFNNGDFSSAFKKIQSAGKGLFVLMPTWAKAIFAVVTALQALAKAGSQRFFTGLSDMGNFFNPIIDGAMNAGRAVFNAFESITGSDFSFTGIASSGIEFEDTIARAVAVFGATGEEAEALKGTLGSLAREMGGTTRYNAQQAGQAIQEMGQQGWNAKQVEEELVHVLNLATVGNLDLARSAEIVTNGLNAYGMEADEAQKYVDTLAQISVKSGTNVEQLGQALENSAPMARALGIDIEDTGIALGLMGDNFIKSGKAGTSLKTFLANMANPTKKMTKCLKDNNLESARQKILNGDLVGGYKEMAKAMEGMTDAEKAQIATILAGKEGATGFLAIVNSGVEGIEELEDAMKESENVAQHMADTFDSTLKGALMNLQSAIEERLLQVFDKVKPVVTEVTKVLDHFFSIWNGMDKDYEGLTGFADAIYYIRTVVQQAMPKITQFIQDGISNLNNFINGDTFDNILQIGTSIIQSICDGIIKSYESGDLTSAITGFISKICDWIDENDESVIGAGQAIFSSIKEGITNNSDKLNNAMDSLFNIVNTWVNGKKDVIGTLGGTVGASLIKGLGKGLLLDLGTTVGNFFTFLITTFQELTLDLWNLGTSLASYILDGLMAFICGRENWDYAKEQFANLGSWLSETLGIESQPVTSKAQDAGLDTGKGYGEKVKDGLDESKGEISATANEVGTVMADGINEKLANLSTEELELLEEEFDDLLEKTQTTASGMRDAFGSIRNGARDSFVGMVNIIRNQCLNMTKIVNNQSKNSRDEFCRQMMSMAKIAKTQMYNAYKSVTDYMDKIKSAVSKTLELKVNVSKTITTSYKDGNGEQSINALGTFSQLSAMTRATGIAPMSSMGLGTLVGTAVAQASNGTPIVIELVTNLDGKTVAQQTAQYMNNELKVIEKRKNRRNGN